MKKNNALLGILLISALIGVSSAQYTPTNIEVAYQLSYTGSGLQPGDSGILTLTVTNAGGLNAESVILEVRDSNNIYVSKQWYIGTLVPLDSRTVSTKLTVPHKASIGLNILTVEAFYDGYNSAGKKENFLKKTWEVPIEIKADPLFLIEEVKTDRYVLSPGDTVKLEVRVKNTGIGTAYDTNGELSLSAITGISAIGAAKQSAGDVGSGEYADFGFTIYLDDSLATGAYSIPLVVSYEDKGHTASSSTLYAGIRVSGDVRLSLSIYETDPDEIHKGDEDVKITIKVDNPGSKELRNLKVTFIPQSPFENAKSYVQTKDLGSLSAGSSKNADFYTNVAEDATVGETVQSFKVEYKVDNIEHTKTVNLSIDVKDHPDFDLISEETTALSGGTGELRLTVRNIGSSCDSITVWALKKSDQPFDFEDRSEFIGDLGSGEEGDALLQFSVTSDAKAKEYILPLEVRCTKDGEVLTFSESVRINVVNGGKSDLLTYGLTLVVITAIVSTALKLRKKQGGA